MIASSIFLLQDHFVTEGPALPKVLNSLCPAEDTTLPLSKLTPDFWHQQFGTVCGNRLLNLTHLLISLASSPIRPCRLFSPSHSKMSSEANLGTQHHTPPPCGVLQTKAFDQYASTRRSGATLCWHCQHHTSVSFATSTNSVAMIPNLVSPCEIYLNPHSQRQVR